ncbi:hypothetical protein [Rhizobium phaseoli]|uniref:hypothetical protein n=1 Tax=Rhizobium phaseoli TaxID=396 RepID=UPI002557585C|nr:hypothetical protein [Rhizobium phaseoli]MDK4729371.1 hypothetical protein [Rhizobium phaseoli]
MEEVNEPVVWYRFTDPWTAGDEPYLSKIPVKRETPKCVVLDEYGVERYVLKDARKRYAYPTKELALDSYIIRKQRQIQINAARHDAAKENLEAAFRFQRGEKKPVVSPFSFCNNEIFP